MNNLTLRRRLKHVRRMPATLLEKTFGPLPDAITVLMSLTTVAVARATVLSLILTVSATSAGAQDTYCLRQLAKQNGFLIGTAMRDIREAHFKEEDHGTYLATVRREYNIVTLENAFKWQHLQPQRHAPYAFEAAEQIITFAEEHQIRVHGHPLIWPLRDPAWVKNLPSAEALGAVLAHHIATAAGRFKGRIAVWDVVNEAITLNETENEYGYRKTHWDRYRPAPGYIIDAFKLAHAADPHAQLLYNDFDLALSTRKSKKVLEMVDALRDADAPIHGVGFQMHVTFKRHETFLPELIDKLRTNMALFAAAALDVYITEFDLMVPTPVTRADLQRQGDVYGAVLRACREQPRCRALQTWGFTDRYAGILAGQQPDGRPNKDAFAAPLPFDAQYQPKPAYVELWTGLAAELGKDVRRCR